MDFVYDVPTIERIGHLTKRDSVAEVLRREILSNRLRPGTQLRQEAIAERLGVSPTPVREAFRLLEAEGYVQARAHRGVVVVQRKYDDMIDAYEVRLALESLAVRRLAQPRPNVMEELRKIVAAGSKAMHAGDTDAFRRASVRFHERFIAAADSPILAQLNDRLVAFWFFFPQDPSRMARAHREHVSLLEAIERHDVDAALKVLRGHLEANIDLLRRVRDQAASAEANGGGAAQGGTRARRR